MEHRAKTYSVSCTVQDTDYVLYTCPANCRSHMNLLYIANGNGNSPDVSVVWDRADSTHIHILGAKNLVSGGFIQWSGAYIVLEPGETITIIPSGVSSPHIDALCTVEEYFMANRAQ